MGFLDETRESGTRRVSSLCSRVSRVCKLTINDAHSRENVDDDLKAALKASSKRLKGHFSDIVYRHSTPLLPSSSGGGSTAPWLRPLKTRALLEDDDDIIDLSTMEIVQDRGVLRGLKSGSWQLGGRGGGSSESGDDWEDVDEDDESEDEIAAVDALESRPSLRYLEERMRQEEDRRDMLDFMRAEKAARAYRAGTATGNNGVDTINVAEEEWERDQQRLEQGRGLNELLDVDLTNDAQHLSKEDDDDELAVMEVTPVTDRTLARSSSVAASSASPASTASKRRASSAVPSSSATRFIRNRVAALKMDESSSPAPSPAKRRQSRSLSTKPILPRTSSGSGPGQPERSSPPHLTPMPPLPLHSPQPKLSTSYSLPNLTSIDEAGEPDDFDLPPLPSLPQLPRRASGPVQGSSGATAMPAVRHSVKPTIVPPRFRRHSFSLEVKIDPRRRSVTPAAAFNPRPAPPPRPPAAGTIPSFRPPLPPLVSAPVSSSPLKRQRPSSSLKRGVTIIPDSEDEDEDDPLAMSSSSKGDDARQQQQQLATPPNSKNSNAASPTKKARRSRSPLKTSVAGPSLAQLFDDDVVAQLATPPLSQGARYTLPPLPALVPDSAPLRPHSAKEATAFDEEEEDELMLTPQTAAAAVKAENDSKPVIARTSLTATSSPSKRITRRKNRWQVAQGGTEWLDLARDEGSDDELDLLGSG